MLLCSGGAIVVAPSHDTPAHEINQVGSVWTAAQIASQRFNNLETVFLNCVSMIHSAVGNSANSIAAVTSAFLRSGAQLCGIYLHEPFSSASQLHDVLLTSCDSIEAATAIAIMVRDIQRKYHNNYMHAYGLSLFIR